MTVLKRYLTIRHVAKADNKNILNDVIMASLSPEVE